MTELSRITGKSGRRGGKATRRARRRPRHHYFAFLSYSHKDEALAAWLHAELERFRVPAQLVGRIGDHGVIPRRLTPIFRDQQELAAATDLGEEIEQALAGSQFLIVLCSPDAAASRWTNAEIAAFKRSHPDGCVLAAIGSGEPFGSDIPGRESEECFPPALRQRYDRLGRPTGKRAEPLAADLRADHGGRRTGFLKLVAGMLDVGLDDLVQREATRRQRRLAFVASASLAGMVLASVLAVTAIQARDEARDQRREAEGMVAFMLGDLKDKLEPIGRLDALDGVGARILDYYSKQGTAELPDNALLQRSQALGLMGQVANQRGESARAVRFYREALAGTGEAVERDPADPKRLYDHAQNVFWLGALSLELGDLSKAESAMRDYQSLANRMVAREPDNMRWRMEQQNAEANLGTVLYWRRSFGEAARRFGRSLNMVRALAAANPTDSQFQLSLVEAQAWLADALYADGQIAMATRTREDQVARLERMSASPRADVEYRMRLVRGQTMLGLLYSLQGRRDRAGQYFAASLANADRLVQTEPDNVRWKTQLMNSRFEYAAALLRSGQIETATPHIAAGCALNQDLLARKGQYASWLSGARTCLFLQSRTAIAANRPGQAIDSARRAVAAARRVKSVDSASDRLNLAEAFLLLGDAQRSAGLRPDAAASWRQATAALPKGMAETPVEQALRAEILARVGRIDEARAIGLGLAKAGVRRG